MSPEERKKLDEAVTFIEGLKKQQIRAPIDPTSYKVLFDDVPVMKSWTQSSGTASGYLTVRVKGKIYHILTRNV